MIPRFLVFRERLETEWSEVRVAAERAMRSATRARIGGPDTESMLAAAALNLHGFYTGLERTFEWVAREFDGGVPSGPTWHREILDQMTLDVPGVRPRLLRPETRAALDEFLRFRHLVRHVYAWDFAPAKIAALAGQLPAVLELLEADVSAFAAFLAVAAQS